MSASKSKKEIRNRHTIFNDILNFGPDVSHAPQEVNRRLQQLLRKITDINRRIDKLTAKI